MASALPAEDQVDLHTRIIDHVGRQLYDIGSARENLIRTVW